MQLKAIKLSRKLGDPALALVLVGAGLDNPAKLRKASEADLKAIKGVGAATAKRVKTKFKG